jgi:arylsulfate sulfotransferase
MNKKKYLSICFIFILIISACKDDENPPKTPITGQEIDTLIINPSKNAPLTAINNYFTQEESRVELIIRSINSSEPDFIKEFPTFKQFHKTDILGLYPNHENSIILNYYDKNDKLIEQQVHLIKTGPLPVDMPEIIISKNQESLTEPGWNLLSYWGLGNPNKPLIFDKYGNIRWYLDFSSSEELMNLRYDNGIERLKNGNFYFGDINSNAIYEVDYLGFIINNFPLLNHTFHHNVQEKEDGNYLITTSKTGSLNKKGKSTIEDYAIEIDRNSGQLIREWDLKKVLDENRFILSGELVIEPIDWFHGNAIIENKNKDGIIVSGRTQGIINVSNSNQLNWILSTHQDWDTNCIGENLVPYLLRPIDANNNVISDTNVTYGHQNHADFSWPWYAHAPFIMPNGNLILFDNGDNRNFGNSSDYSRAVEYEIDEVNMTIKQVWEYGKNRGDEAFGQYVSDVDYLPIMNNILFTPGFGTNNNGKIGGKIIEVDYSNKNVVFEAIINQPSGAFVSFHRAERLSIYPE